MEKKIDPKKMLGFRHLPSMSGAESTKFGIDRIFNKIGDEMPIEAPVKELDRIFNKIGELPPMPE